MGFEFEEPAAPDDSLLPQTSLEAKSTKKRGENLTWQNVARFSICCLALWGFLNVMYNASLMVHTKMAPRNKDPTCYCGTTTAQARYLGCEYVPMAAGWLPKHCRDDELEEQFDRAGPGGGWPYFADKNGTELLTKSELGSLADSGQEFYTTMEWHIKHCTYYWRKQTRGFIEPRYSGISHIDHCEKIFLKRKALGAINTGSPVLLDGGEHLD